MFYRPLKILLPFAKYSFGGRQKFFYRPPRDMHTYGLALQTHRTGTASLIVWQITTYGLALQTHRTGTASLIVWQITTYGLAAQNLWVGTSKPLCGRCTAYEWAMPDYRVKFWNHHFCSCCLSGFLFQKQWLTGLQVFSSEAVGLRLLFLIAVQNSFCFSNILIKNS